MPQSPPPSLETPPNHTAAPEPPGTLPTLAPFTGALPAVETGLSEREVVEKLAFASRRGRLAGFEAGGEGLFSVAAFGQPFDRRLIAEARARQGGGTRLAFRTRLLWWWPGVYLAVAAFTVWPGSVLTRSLLDTYIPDTIVANWTYWWYFPLAVLPLPWAGRTVWRKSEAAAAESAREAVGKIAGEIGGKVVEGGGS